MSKTYSVRKLNLKITKNKEISEEITKEKRDILIIKWQITNQINNIYQNCLGWANCDPMNLSMKNIGEEYLKATTEYQNKTGNIYEPIPYSTKTNNDDFVNYLIQKYL